MTDSQSKLGVRRDNSEFSAVVGLLECAVAEDFSVDEDDGRSLLNSLRDTLPSLDAQLDAHLVAELTRAGSAIAMLYCVDLAPERCQLLMAIAQRLSTKARGVALRFAQRAHGLATTNQLPVERRLCANGLSILLRESGAPHHALPFALEAAEIARTLQDQVAEARALINAGSALHEQGRHGEATRLASSALKLPKLPQSVRAGAFTLLMNAAQRLRQFELAARAGREALQLSGAPVSIAEAENLVVLERSYIEVLVAVGDVASAKVCFEQLRVTAKACQSERAVLQVDLAETALVLAEMPLRVGVTKMLRLLEQTRGKYVGLYNDILSKLIAAYELDGNVAAVARYTSEMSASILARQSDAVQALVHMGIDVQSRPGNAELLPLAKLTVTHEVPRVDASPEALALSLDVAASQSMFEQLAVAAELQEDTSGRHAIRVGELARLVSMEMGLTYQQADAIGLASRLHDIGKLSLPASLLAAKRQYTADEKIQVQRHTLAGEKILALVPGDAFALAKTIARHHHERFDGKGYPDRLAGDRIPLAARIAKVADVWDALVHERVYKVAWPVPDAIEYFRNNRGTEFCPAAADSLLAVVERALRDSGGSLERMDDTLAAPYRDLPAIRERARIETALAQIPSPWNAAANITQ